MNLTSSSQKSKRHINLNKDITALTSVRALFFCENNKNIVHFPILGNENLKSAFFYGIIRLHSKLNAAFSL